MMQEPILVSACLLGIPCRYDGKAKPCDAVLHLQKTHRLIPVCPEVLGGLPTPREASEIQPDGSVRNRAGEDVTGQYCAGARAALAAARKSGCRVAILKEKSPSCGKGLIYDGHFSGTLIPGNGVTAALLSENGIEVIGESAISDCTDLL